MKINGLKILVSLAALLVAGCAAFYSVTGLATLFSGAYLFALILFASLEFGKLVSTSFLYRWWGRCARWLKIYLTSAVIVLMVITSAGIFGFLSSAYQDSAMKYEIHTTKVTAIEEKVQLVNDEISVVKNRITSLTDARKSQEERLNSISSQIGKTLTGLSAQKLQESTQKLIEQSSSDISKAQEKLDELGTKKNKYSEEILDLKINNEGSHEIQNFQFLADALDMELDTIVMWTICIIIFVFDPLAVALVLAYNVMVVREEEVEEMKKQLPTEEPEEVVETPTNEEVIESEPIEVVEETTEAVEVVEETPEEEKFELEYDDGSMHQPIKVEEEPKKKV
jgi:hypothetical protein